MNNILIVDDSPTMRRMVMASLRSLPGVSFGEASSGLEAIERLALAPVDLMILDLNMPDMHGIEVLGFLRRHQAQHLSDDQLLFSRAVGFLTTSLEVPVHMAETLVSRAYGELKNDGDRRRLDVDNSTDKMAMLTDPASGLTFAVPVHLIFERLIDTPERRRLRVVS